MFVPTLVLKQLYTFGSLRNTSVGARFTLKNRLADAEVLSIKSLSIGGRAIPLDQISIIHSEHKLNPLQLNDGEALSFPLGEELHIYAHTEPFKTGKHTIELNFNTKPFGQLNLKVEGSISNKQSNELRIPRYNKDDFGDRAILKRQEFIKKYTDVELKHINKYSIDPKNLSGNIEHFTGVAQIPMGLAGPLKINGEHAKGEFIIPLATTEGTLVASYNRGMKVLNMCGGAICTVIGDAMQRAPVFVFENAREARAFVQWVQENHDKIAEEAEATSSVAKLQYIDTYLASKFAYLRFNYSTGDAAGQNMVGRATFAACSWIIDHYHTHEIKHFYLESNFATDKKASQINVMKTRGKRVVAECTIKHDVLTQYMRVDPYTLNYHAGVANVGAFMSGANNNGLHSANGITAMFIATGQDVANVAESSAGVLYTELTPQGDLYLNITIPSLIIATYGGGTGLPTQQESLGILGCVGRDKVNKLAEIIAGVVLAGEISLASAISSSDWVSSHEKYGRNR